MCNRIPVSQDKPQHERGTYLHPEAFEQPASAGFLSSRTASVRRSAEREPDPVAP